MKSWCEDLSSPLPGVILLEGVAPVLDQNLCGKSPSSITEEAQESPDLWGSRLQVCFVKFEELWRSPGKIIEKWLDKYNLDIRRKNLHGEIFLLCSVEITLQVASKMKLLGEVDREEEGGLGMHF